MSQTIQALQDRIDVLEAMVGLRVDYDPDKVKALGLRPSHLRILLTLLTTNLATFDYLVAALWGDDPNGGPDDPRKLLTVHICRMRKLLASAGVKIETLWATGYYLREPSKAIARQLIGISETPGEAGR